MDVSFQIKIGSTVFTEKNRDISEITISDEIGLMSDTLNITFSDDKNEIELPRTGVKAEVKVGFDGRLVNFGVYTIDSVEWDLEGRLSVSGRGWDSTAETESKSPGLRTVRNICRIKTKLGDIADDIAKANGLTARVSTSVRNLEVDAYQMNESDLGYLHRITNAAGSTLKVNGSYLILTEKGSSETASGKKLDMVTLRRSDLSSLRFRSDKADEETEGHKAFWTDYKFGKVEASGGSKVQGGSRELPLMFSSEARAKSAMDAEKKKSQHRERRISLSMVGNEKIAAETPVEILEVKKGIDGFWIAERVEHKINSSTFTTSMECYQDKRA